MGAPVLEPRVHIGKVIQNAIVFNFRNGSEKAMNSENLLQTVERLFSILDERDIDYLLVGGIALLQYVEGRNTEDIDLIMALPSLKKAPEITVSKEDKDFARGTFGDLQIDILLTRNRLFDKVRRSYSTTKRFVERDIACATPDGLLLLKLYALPSLYRQGNFARVSLYENDIAMLMQKYRPAMESLFEELSPYLSDTDLGAVRDIVSEIQERIERFEKKSDSEVVQ